MYHFANENVILLAHLPDTGHLVWEKQNFFANTILDFSNHVRNAEILLYTLLTNLFKYYM